MSWEPTSATTTERTARELRLVGRDEPPLVLLVDQDHLWRAPLLLVLLRGGFDVIAASTPAQVHGALLSEHRTIVAVVSLDGLRDLSSALRPMFQARPSLLLLALTQRPHALAQKALHAAGVRRFGVASQHMPSVAIADGVRQLLRTRSWQGD